jgi:methylphosphotriester-DNA--protein-cysteine methyltransferase
VADSLTLDILLKLAETGAIVGSLGVGLFTIGRSSSRVEMAISAQATDLADMKDELKKLADVIIQQAVQSNRIENLATQLIMTQRTLEDLRRNRGFIVEKNDEAH